MPSNGSAKPCPAVHRPLSLDDVLHDPAPTAVARSGHPRRLTALLRTPICRSMIVRAVVRLYQASSNRNRPASSAVVKDFEKAFNVASVLDRKIGVQATRSS